MNQGFTKNTTIYNSRSIRLICRNIMNTCHEACSLPTSRLTLPQSRKYELMMDAVRQFISRRREREQLKWQKQHRAWSEISATIAAMQAELNQSFATSAAEQAKSELLDQSLWSLKENKSTTTTGEQPAAPAYRFIVRNSLFPDPKNCNFFHTAPAQIFDLPKFKTDGSAVKVSARSAPLTAMVTQATVPPNAPHGCDSASTRASIPGRPPKYGKISGIGMYIKYNPGSDLSLHASLTRRTTALYYDKTNAQCLTGYTTVTKRATDRQEFDTFRKSTEQYSTGTFLPGTVYATEPLGETDRQEFYYAFRKPPPYRDKPYGTEFNSTINTKGASLSREHYQAFRRPPPYRDKHSQSRIMFKV